MKKLAIFILIIIGAFIAVKKTNILRNVNISLPSVQSATVQLKYYPLSAQLKVDNHSYNSSNGELSIAIAPGIHHINLSAPGYSVWTKDIDLNSGETKQFPFVYLFPVHWQQKNIVPKHIAQFYLSSDANQILYITQGAEHQWCLYQRQTKEVKCFYTSSSLPKKLIIAPSFKKAIAQFSSNNWKLIFLPPSLVTKPLSLNKNITKDQIYNIYFSPLNENILIAQGAQGIFSFNFIDDNVKRLYSSPTSSLLVDNDSLYFLTKNGILTSLSLSSATSTSKTVSSFSFIVSDPLNIIIKKLPSSNTFFVIDNSHTLYLLKSHQQIPSTLASGVQNIKLSPSLKYFVIWANKKISIASYPNSIIQDENIFSSSLPVWFLNDNYLLVDNNSNINIFNLLTKKIWPVTSNVTDHTYYFDPATKYIFYLSPAGIQRISI